MYLSDSEIQDLKRACEQHGFAAFSDLVRAAVRDYSGRIPESKGGIYMRVDPEDFEDTIAAAQEVLAKEGNGLQESWRGDPDPQRRSSLRQRAARYLDAAADLSSLLERFRQRRHVLEQGMRPVRERHREKKPDAATAAP